MPQYDFKHKTVGQLFHLFTTLFDSYTQTDLLTIYEAFDLMLFKPRPDLTSKVV